MPGYDGTGPMGTGPLSGGGRGFCTIALPPLETGEAPYGYAGLQGMPIRYALRGAALWARGRAQDIACWRRPATGLGSRRRMATLVDSVSRIAIWRNTNATRK